VWRKPDVIALTFGVALAACARAMAAGEADIELADGPGRDQVRAACSMCHSLDYIVMNSPFQDRAGWKKTVDKMITVMGAPLTDAQAAVIVDYLDRHYGK
jgi:hypothetical protein